MSLEAEQIIELFETVLHNNVIEKPKAIAGGLLHQMYQVKTEEECYAVKVLNPSIMKRTCARDNYLFSESFARFAVNEGISGVAAEQINDQVIQSFEHQNFMLFKWVDGLSCEKIPLTIDMAEQMGHILHHLHHIGFDGTFELEFFEPINWKSYVKKLNQKDSLWQQRLLKDLAFIQELDERACESMNIYPANVISHRDLDPKNVMMLNGELTLIDWESAGPVNRIVELLEVALYWSNDGQNKGHFQQVILSYDEEDLLGVEELIHAIDALCYNKLRWLDYSIKRALGDEINTESEKLVGIREVISTTNSIKACYDRRETIIEYIEEIKG